MDLATHQRALLGLFRGTRQPRPDDDPYVQTVARSPDLVEARRNIFLWRVYVLERSCVLTFRLLRRKGLLAEAIGRFINARNISPIRETQAPAFLETVAAHADALIAAVARFELALMKAREPGASACALEWSVDPHGVLNALARDLPLCEPIPPGAFQIIVSPELPGLFEVRRLS